MNSSSPETITDLPFEALNTVSGLQQFDQKFLSALSAKDSSLHKELLAYRQEKTNFTAIELSEFLLALAPHIEAFIASSFDIEDETKISRDRINNEKAIHEFKKQFIQRRSRRYRGEMDTPFAELDLWLRQQINNNDDMELAVSNYAIGLLEDTVKFENDITRLTQWIIHIRNNNAADHILENWVSFRLPSLINYAQLVPLQDIKNDPVGRRQANPKSYVRRDGFGLTDHRMNLRQVMDEVNYCIYCHDHDGDFCSRGFPENKKDPDSGFRVNPLGEILVGCPVGEKVSEMQLLKRDGYDIAALAMAARDNPMLPATGHRICNDCMKACIYQKQDPVNIPEVETGILTDVLNLSWGVEIYLLLVRWNPLRQEQYLPGANNNRRVLVIGLGPAGFTMSHYLSMAGCNVTGVDGLKLEPLDQDLLTAPIRNYSSIVESLDDRILAGFGGVAEYGITVRWDKNFLKLIYISLARRENIGLSGGVRFGGTLTIEDAWNEGFEHISIANGAGLPRVIPMINSLARGMRQANDFLMALQLTGAAKFDSLANLQVRLPAVVIGGGLTAIDTATELQSYYIRQVEKHLQRFTVLEQTLGKEKIFAGLDEENRGILNTFLEHGKAVADERKRAADCNEKPDFLPLLRSWGGVTLTYRRGLNESPAYLRNHDEIVKALQEGIYYAEGVEPVEAMLDEYGHVTGLRCRIKQQLDGRWLDSKEQTLPARAIMVAAGASPNTVYENEYPGSFQMDGNHFMPHVCHPSGVQPVSVADHCKADEFGPFTSYAYQDKRITFIGDTHPVFHGSVVKAIASSQRTYPEIIKLIDQQPEDPCRTDNDNFTSEFQQKLSATVDRIDSTHPAVVELWVKAPLAAKNYQPGQFFRLQTFEKLSRSIENTRLQIPIQTVSGAGVDGDKVRLLLLRFGANARIAEQLNPGDPLVLMGPTGAPAELGHQRTVMVLAGAWGAAVMIDLGRALRAAGNRVLFFASFRCQDDIYFKDELEQCADQIVWASATDSLIECRRPQDSSVQQANVIELIKDYEKGTFTAEVKDEDLIKLSDVDEIMIMGSTGLLKAMQHSLKGDLEPLFKNNVHATGTVGSPMQCMMKGVCGQCLQWQIDPETGKRTRAVFSCAKQDQPLSWIDLDNLGARQAQNRLSEYMTGLWANHVLENA